MKTKKSILLALGATLIASTITFAQSNSDLPIVKILPYREEGFLRLLYMGDQGEPVTVSFYKGNTLISKDKVETDDLPKGFIKLYDVSNLKYGNYKVKVTSMGNSISHAFNISKKEPIWTQYWTTQLKNDSKLPKLQSKDSMAITSEN
jgi:hypothetical protein